MCCKFLYSLLFVVFSILTYIFVPFENLANWITAIATLAMAIIAFFALNTWKKETEYNHIVEFITISSIIIEYIDDYFNNGYCDESVINKTVIELQAWAPFWNNEANRYSENIENLYRNLIKEKNYLYSFYKSINKNDVDSVCNTIKAYKDSMNIIVSAKMNLCHQDVRMRQASITIIKDKSELIRKKQSEAQKAIKKAKNKLL